MAKDPQIKRLMIAETKKILEETGNVTIKDIAERCYVNIASVNYYFGSKDNLIFNVLSEVLADIKSQVIHMILNRTTEDSKEFLEQIITLIYNFAVDHIGMLKYFFVSDGFKEGQLFEFVRSFFMDPEFVKLVYKNLGEHLRTTDEKLLQVKYIMVFSSFFMPLIIQMISPTNDSDHQLDTFRDPIFKKHFIDQLIKIID